MFAIAEASKNISAPVDVDLPIMAASKSSFTLPEVPPVVAQPQASSNESNWSAQTVGGELDAKVKLSGRQPPV